MAKKKSNAGKFVLGAAVGAALKKRQVIYLLRQRK